MNLTPVLSRERVRHELAVRHLTVVRTEDLAPGLRRITLGGDLAGFSSLGPSDHVKVFFPDPRTGELHAPRMTPTGIERPEGVELISRDYTPRAWRADELDIDFVLHGDEGPASAWASAAQPGAPIVVAGPRGSRLAPAGADWHLIGSDETALPAVARWLETLSPDAVAAVLVEVPDAAHEVYLADAVRRGHTITWLHRDGAAPGTTTLLADAVRALTLPDGLGFAWFGGEATSLRAVRRHLRQQRGMDPAQVDVSGYWKCGTAGFDHHAPVDPDDPA
ncbi:siderophore-interacting protein [Georgenia faecalis]|uniref:siderophore-interacting protein n=1 Tax=Georgenia faecalis TaxID=2483799 RepID=UPI000FDC5326|nr:siderophore-interacting protein [Georgenia faecalis]